VSHPGRRHAAVAFLGLLNPFSVTVGLLSAAMFLMQGASWLSFRTEGELRDRARRAAGRAWVAFIALWVVVTSKAIVGRHDRSLNEDLALAAEQYVSRHDPKSCPVCRT
jgi:cytochrome bd-type quinol oxidase subunit 2